MPHPRFLVDVPLAGPGEYDLDRQESHHAATVLRLRAGDEAIVFDGRGGHAHAVLVHVGKNGVRVRAEDAHQDARQPVRLTIASAIPKGKRWQTLVEKCTELGADRIIPLLTERSVAKGEGDAVKWRRWAIEAAKQCRRTWLPEIREPVRLADVPALAESEGAVLLLADRGGDAPPQCRERVVRAGGAVALIGPEGGLSDGELAYCRDRGALGIALSPFVLRVETAAAVMCAFMRETGL
ncbi:MAG: 16S rRNA (uracil(1498)-N(3))-methyltransferase [Planctomycetota bacterium]|jgi:16S rRNA (uracil1498-N3)-methyltransferase|nr:16S rRNA (uracil(1498)-N(3))-methyltransferase [Planctomycetota bacterium]